MALVRRHPFHTLRPKKRSTKSAHCRPPIEDIEAKIPRSAVIDPLVSQSWVGEILDFGTLSLGSASEQNTQFKNIRYLPRPKKLKEILGLNQGE